MNLYSLLNFRRDPGVCGRLVRGAFLLGLIHAAQLGAIQVTLTWEDTSTDETGFKIERAVAGGNFTQVATVPADTTTWVDNGVASGTAYTYRIRAYNEVGDSPFSNVVSNTPGSSTITISTQPASPPPVDSGAQTSFTALASGNPAPAIQWQVSTNSGTNWANLSETAPYSGVNATTMTITGVPVSFDRNQYRAVFTNGISTLVSNAGVLTFTSSPPQNVRVNKVVEPPK